MNWIEGISEAIKYIEENIRNDMKIEDIVNPNTKFVTEAYAESQVNNEKHGAKIQFERRGYYFIDKEPVDGKPMEVNFIPDGKTKAISIIGGKVDVKTLAKGDTAVVEDSKKEDKKKSKEDKKKAKLKKK